MIELHRLSDDGAADRIEEKLNELVVAYRSIAYKAEGNYEHPLPHLRENEKVFSGEESIKQYLYRLEDELSYQRSLSGDGCYIDPESGEIC